MPSPAHHAHLIKSETLRLGFLACGMAKAVPLHEDAKRLEKWLSAGYQAGMQYMDNNFDLRVNPTLLVPGAQSVITLLFNYYPAHKQQPNTPRIAKYAYGTDYHFVIKDKLNQLLQYIYTHIGHVNGRGFVDSAPVLERAWAVRSGLGWVGKNGNLINRRYGSFFFIATLITDLPLPPDPPFPTHHCGTCTRCIDSCPTDAILPNATIDARKCISYLTIELKDEAIPSIYQNRLNNWLFGCDICQDVCPWNRFSIPHHIPEFNPIPEILHLSLQEWETLTEETFKQIFKKSPLKRSKYNGIMRNIRALR